MHWMAEISTQHQIHRLPDDLVNRIAAGEVIERPASIVKELLENSIDAGATVLTIEIRKGGSELIRITDNGTGIHPDDLAIAMERHTTSKLFPDSDLSRISTLGFRGEALSSIAAVAQLEITSRQAASTHASVITNGNQDNVVKPAAHPPGTCVQVGQLFARQPARRKFLRSEKTEFIHILDLVKKIALSRINLSVKLIHNGRQVLNLHDDSANPEYRLQKILGKKFTENKLPMNQQTGTMKLYGWLARPEFARNQSDQQFFFLNGRIIRDRMVTHAIRLAYEPFLFPGRFPGYVLYLETDLASADINVHPTKHEVRFRHSREVHNFIYGSVSLNLTDADYSGKELKKPDDFKSVIPVSNLMEDRPDYINLKWNKDRRETGSVLPQSFVLFSGRFMIVEYHDRNYLIDIYRFRQSQIEKEIADKIPGMELSHRPLLVPLIITLLEREADNLDKFSNVVSKFGLIYSRVGPTKIQVREIPITMPFLDPVAVVKDMISIICKNNKKNLEHNLARLIINHVNDGAPHYPQLSELNIIIDELDNFLQRTKTTKKSSGIFREIDLTVLENFMRHG